MSDKVITHRDIAHSIRFRQHPAMTACWIWIGTFYPGGQPRTGTGKSARQEVYQRLIGTKPGHHLKMACGAPGCVNPHHMKLGQAS